VLWLGLDPAEPLANLKRAIDASLGPDTEHASYSPHLTLARFTHKPDPTLTQFLSRHRGYHGAPWPVACFTLYKSTLHPGAAVHEVVATYPLAQICRDP
jgi:2'-5' RNA ligase